MKLTVNKKNLVRALERACSVANPRAPMPIMANALLSASGKELKVAALDLTIAVSTTVELTSRCDDFLVCVPAKSFTDRVRALDGESIVIVVDDKSVSVKSDSAPRKYSITSVPGDEFPRLPIPQDVTAEVVHEIQSSTLATLIASSVCAVSHEQERVALSSMRLTFGSEFVEAAATDGHRVATVRAICDKTGELGQALIPLKSVMLISRFLDSGERAIRLSVSGSNLVLADGESTLCLKMADGTFPPIDQVIPSKPVYAVTLDRERFAATIKAVALSAEVDKRITMTVGGGELRLDASDPDTGSECVDTMECETRLRGEVKISFNADYMLQALGSFVCDTLLLDVHAKGDIGEPMMLIDAQQNDAFRLFHLVMPTMLK